MRLETLVLELMADDSGASAVVDKFVERAAKKIQRLERSMVSPRVDLKQLHELNRVLDVKQKHIKQVADYAQRSPIRVRVDASEVKAAKAEMMALRGQLSGMSATVRARVEHRFSNADDRRQTNDIVRSVNILGGGLKDIVNAVKSTGKGKGGVGGVVRSVAGAVLNTPITIAKGALMGFGQDVVKDFSGGFKNVLNTEIGKLFGSTELMGEQAAQRFIENIKSAGNAASGLYGDALIATAEVMAQDLEKQLKDQQAFSRRRVEVEGQREKAEKLAIKAIWDGNTKLAGEYERMVESLSQTLRQIEKAADKAGVSTAGLTELESAFLSDKSVRQRYVQNKAQQMDLRPALQAEVESYQNQESVQIARKANAKRQADQRQIQKDDAREGGRILASQKNAEAQSYRAQAAQTLQVMNEVKKQSDVAIQNAQKKKEEAESRLKALTSSSEYQLDPASFYEEELDIKQQIKVADNFLTDAEAFFQSRIDQAEKLQALAKTSQAEANSLLKEYTKDIAIRRNLAEIVKKLTGQDVDYRTLPQIIVTEGKVNGSAAATYSPVENVIRMQKSAYNSLASNQFASQDNLQNYGVIAHELAHSVDAGLGSEQGLASFNANDFKGINSITLEDMVSRRGGMQGSSLIDFLKYYQGKSDYPQVRNKEISAEFQARKLMESQMGIPIVSPFQAFATASASQGQKINEVQSLAKGYEPLVGSSLKKLESLRAIQVDLTKKMQELEAKGSASAANISDEDLNAYSQDVYTQLETLELINKKIESIATEVTTQVQNVSGYTGSIGDIESMLDDAFNLEDFKLLQNAKKRIGTEIGKIKKDPNLDKETKKALIGNLKDLQAKAKIDTKTTDLSVVDVITSPLEAMQFAIDKGRAQLTDSAVSLVHAFTDPIAAITNNPMGALAAGGGGMLQGANSGIRAIAPAVSNAYGVAQGVENAALSILPYGHLAKKGIQIGAVTAGLPMAASAIPALAPVAGILGMAHGAGAAGAGALAAGQMGAISSIPIIGGQVAGLLTTAASGLGGVVAEMAAAAIAVNAVGVGAKAIVGQALEPATKQQLKALQPGQERIAEQTGKALKGLAAKAQNIEQYLPTLPESQRDLVGYYLPQAAAVQQANRGTTARGGVPALKSLKPAEFQQLDTVTQKNLQQELIAQYQGAQKTLYEFSEKVKQSIPSADRMKGDIGTMMAAFKRNVQQLEKQSKVVGVDVSKYKMNPDDFKGVTLDADAVELPDLSKMKPDLSGSAKDTIDGFTQGLRQEAASVEAAFVEIAQAGQEGFDKTMKIQSPSVWAIERMKFIALGLQVGAINELPKIKGMGEMTAEEYAKGLMMGDSPELPLPVPQLKPELKANLDQYNKEQSERKQHWEQVDNKNRESNDPLWRLEMDTERLINQANTEGMAMTGNTGIDEVLLGTNDHINNANEAMDKMESNLNRFGDTRGPVEGLKSFFGELINSNPVLQAVNERLSGTWELVKNIGIGAAAAVGLFTMAGALKEVAANALLAYRNIEGVYTSSKLVQGGTKYIESMSDQVLKLGMEYTSTLKQGMSFAAGMAGTSLESQSQEMFLSLSKSLSYLQLSDEQYSNALLALQQISSKGVVSMEELRQQLGEAVPGAMSMAAEAMNTNVQGLIQMVESGGLTSDEFMPRFTAMLESRVEGLAPAAESSLTAAMGRFNAGREKTMIDIGANLAPSVIPLINTAADAMIALSENADKVVWSIQSLSIGLATLGLAAVIDMVTKSVLAMGGWSAVIGKLNVGLRTLGTTAKAAMSVALKPLLIMLAAVTAYEVISFAFKTTGSEEVTNAIDVIDRQLAKLDKRSVSTVDLKGYVETNNGFLNFLDKASRDVDNLLKKLGPLGDLMSMVSLPTAIGNLQGRNLLPTFGDVEFDRTSKQIEELQKKAGEIISGSSQVTDPLAMGGLIEQLDSFDRQIATTQSRIAALRSGDAKANAGQIEALGQELKSLNEQRSELLKQFDAVGQNAREQTRDALVGVRDERKAQLDSLDPKQQPQKVAQLKQEIAGLDKQIGQLNGQIKTYDQYMQELGNTLSRQRLTFINLSAAIAQMNQNFEIGISEQKASLITNQIERGLQTQVDELENLQFAVFEQSEMMRQLQIEFAAQQNYLASDAIAPGDRALVEEIIGKPLTDASMQDITELRMRLENDQNIKGKFGDEILGVIERMVNIKTELSKAEVGLAEANKALEQFELTRKDYIRDTARQFIDLSRQIQAQKIQDQRAVEDLQFTIIDTSIQMQRQTRQIQSAYNDMATELNIQLATAEKTLRDTQDKVAINQMRAANIAIAPGNSDSVARQIDNILLQFVEQSLNLDANERQIKIDVLNLERERTGLLRRIRELEEANADAIRNHERQLRDLGRQVQDLTRQFEDSALQMKRATEDLVESIRRSDITSEVGRMLMGMAQGLTGSYNPQAVAFSGYSGALPPPPPGGYGILPGGIVNQSYQRQLVQPNFSYADPWNPTPAEAARFGGAQSYQPDFDPIAVRDANRAYLNEAPRRQAGDLGILQDAMNNNQSGRSLTAPAQPQYQPMQSMGYRSMNDYGYRSMGQRPASVTPTQIIAPAPVYNQPQSSTRTGLGLPPGYQSLQGLANQYLVNHPMFAPTTRDGASALVLALGIGGTEAFGRGTQRTDWFTRMGGTGNNMKGFAQYNQVYHARNTANPQSYLNTLGGTLHGQTRTPNSARKFDFAGNLTSQVLGGRVNTGSDLIRFMQGTGLGGSNWQGVSDGWKRVPGLADTLVDYLKNTIPNLQSKLNFGIPESIELGQTAQAIDPRQAQPLIDLSRPLLGIFDTIDRNSGSRQTPGFINSFDRLIIKPLQDIFKDEKLGTVNQGIRKLQSDMELWDKPPGYVAPGTGKDVSPPPIEYTPVNPNQFRPTGFNANDPQFTQVYQREMAMPNVGQFTMPQMPAAPPMLNYDPLKNLVQEIDSINKQIIAARSDENASSFLMSQRQALDSILSLTRGLMDANRKNTQSYMDSALAINNMRTNVKGYQTILESALQTGADNYMQYEQQKRSIQDQRIAIERQLESRETIKANAANMLAMSKNLTGEQRAQLETAVGQADQQLAQLSLHYEYLGVQEQQLNNMQRQASFNAQNLAFEQMRLQAIDGFTSKMGELATLQYEMGGQLINTSGIMQAQAAMVGLEARAKSEAMALKLNTEETSKFVEMRQQIAELNLAKAYRDAVPFVGELTAGMRDMLLEAKSFGEVISGVLKNMATQIFDLLVGKPIQNWLSQNVVSIFGLDQVSENMPEFYGMGTGLLVDSAAASSPYFRQGMTDPTMYGAPMQAPPILESFTGAVDTVAGGLTEVSGQLPNFTSSIVENTIQTAQSVVTEQTALMTFIGALNAATLALVQFTASMGMNTATTAAGGLFNTFTGGGGGILGAIAGGFTGNTVQLPAFAQGIDDVMTQERLQSGKSPLLAVLHQGEAVLSTLNGDAQLYRALKRSGDWEQFKAKSPERYALGSDNIGGPSVSPGRSGGTGGGVTVVQNWTVKTNDADSFKRSQKQMDAEAAARYRRTMRGG